MLDKNQKYPTTVATNNILTSNTKYPISYLRKSKMEGSSSAPSFKVEAGDVLKLGPGTRQTLASVTINDTVYNVSNVVHWLSLTFFLFPSEEVVFTWESV